MASSKIHGIYPVNAPRTEVSKLQGAPTLLQVNIKILTLLEKIKKIVCNSNPFIPAHTHERTYVHTHAHTIGQRSRTRQTSGPTPHYMEW